ncbi:Transposase DDE domain group 1 [Microbispora rosea]|uniref:Transposase DDE domain group 1 n=1 Tax=Microbispora rosea TaxID=58117 RepID=A0A1N7HAI7_9ACTN|nr:IS1380 family transposase [Microbispora rosea]GIH52330.1 IS1380 family transposase [Microbispora rosea subsp. rosea]SIS21895.1 Transposase DDE domain group 1 [Microbispora rosea]
MKTIVSRRKIMVSADGSGLLSQAGGLLLKETLRVTGLDAALSAELERWRASRAVHDPGKVIADLALTMALGGDCLADIAMLRAQSEVFGPIASDPTVSRLIDRLAADPARALKAIRAARAIARERAWMLAGTHAPGADNELIPIDIDATIVIAHSDKDQAAPTWKKTFGFHPMTVFADHGPAGGGEPLAIVLRPGNAGSNTAADHITATRLAAAQLPKQRRRQVLIRTDSGGGTREFLSWLTRPGRRLSYSIGFALTEEVQAAILALPQQAWTPAYDAEGQVRPGAWVAELTGLVKLDGWPKGMRLIVRRERPHPGAQLRFTDIDGHRFTCFVTNTKRGQLADLELRHRRRARCEDRIRAAKDTGLRNLPLHDFAQNEIWCEVVALACELIAWMQMLALDGPARRYEPKRLRLRLFAVAARLVRGGRRLRLRIAAYWPWAGQLVTAVTRLQALPAPT